MVNYQKRIERRREHYDILVSCYDVLYLKILLVKYSQYLTNSARRYATYIM